MEAILFTMILVMFFPAIYIASRLVDSCYDTKKPIHTPLVAELILIFAAVSLVFILAVAIHECVNNDEVFRGNGGNIEKGK